MTATETDKTTEVLKEMLMEDTGRALCDSGDAYGRNYERNQKNGVTEEPEATLTTFIWTTREGERQCDLGVTLNVLPWLSQCLEFDPELDAQFQAFANQPEWEREGWMEVVEAWIEQLPHLERGAGFEQWVNSYNGEDALSQVIQYRPFTVDDGERYYDYFSHVALQIHGGCDVRGGYTAPRIFRHYSEMWSIMDNARVSLNCGSGEIPGNVSDDQLTIDGTPAKRHCGAHWTSYNAGYEWDAYDGDGNQIESLGDYELRIVDGDDGGEAGTIIVVQNADDQYNATKVYCPHCGVGELWAAGY